MKKKILCGFLSAAMVLSICPATALAYDDKKHDYNDLVPLTECLDFRNVSEDIADEKLGYEWYGSSRTLFLRDFRVSVPLGQLEEKAAIYLPDESTIEIKGDDNVIETLSYHCDAIYCEGELWLVEDGKLEIYTESPSSSAIYAIRGPVVFDDKVEIIAEADGYILYVKNAKGSKPIISFRDEAKLTFPKEYADEHSILVTHKASVKPADNWLDFAETEEEWDEVYINLIAKSAVKADKDNKNEVPVTPPAAEVPSEDTTKQSEYQITIGNAAIKKDGSVTYVSDAKPYLSHGYTMLPLRALLNVTGANVDIAWDAVTKTITVTEKNTTDSQYVNSVTLAIGEAQMVHGTDYIKVSTPAELKDGRTFVALRDWMNILSALNMPASDLAWNAKTQTVTFTK